MKAKVKTKIFGTDIEITFEGYAEDAFYIEDYTYDKSKYSDFQNTLFTQYIDNNIEMYEDIINKPVNPYE